MNRGVELGVLKMRADEHKLICCPTETIFDLLSGQLHIAWEGSGCAEVISRTDPLRESATPLHVPKDTWVTIDCMSPRAEVALIQLENGNYFAPRLQHRDDAPSPRRQREGVLQIYPFGGGQSSPGAELTVGEATYPAPGGPPAQTSFYPLSRTGGRAWFGIWCAGPAGPRASKANQ